MNTGRTCPRGHLSAAAAALALSAAIAVTLAPADAHARLTSRGWVGVDAAFLSPSSPTVQPGVAGELGIELSFDDFWSVVASTGLAYHLGRDPEDEDEDAIPPLVISDVTLGARYAFDVIQYVPHVGVGLVYYPLGTTDVPNGRTASLGVELEVGLAWRIDREWSLGGRIALQSSTAEVGDGFSLYAAAGLHLGYHWRW